MGMEPSETSTGTSNQNRRNSMPATPVRDTQHKFSLLQRSESSQRSRLPVLARRSGESMFMLVSSVDREHRGFLRFQFQKWRRQVMIYARSGNIVEGPNRLDAPTIIKIFSVLIIPSVSQLLRLLNDATPFL